MVELGAAMIVYTVRGGSAAVIWTDVVQMFIYIAGALVVFVALLNQIPGGFGEVVRLGSAADGVVRALGLDILADFNNVPLK